jgi:hypothetical protein
MDRITRTHGFMLAARTTSPHFSVSSAMTLPKSVAEPTSGVLPKSASRALMVELARPALISVFNVATISEEVCLGAPKPGLPADVNALWQNQRLSQWNIGRINQTNGSKNMLGSRTERLSGSTSRTTRLK